MAFSNWFHYYLKNNSILNSFAKEVLSLNRTVKFDKFSVKTEVLREKEHIDLLVIDADSKQMLVIENKIKSGINGKRKYKKQAQDSEKNKKEQNVIEEEEEEEKENTCQLAEYKKSAQIIARDMGILDERIKYYIFLPNYSTIREEDCCDYNIVKYDKICDFFKKRFNAIASTRNGQYDFDCFVMEQFVKALCRHKSSYPDSLFEDNYRQFIERIKKLNSSDDN